ncbi:MAG: ABC transporter ATP-binding protein [Clostridia bacterium]|nr:ABC transporter ATP-binding protein [Clostridia bacterium]
MEQKQKQIAVEMRNITKTFGSVVANKDVDFITYKGEILSLLGENGSGKTTLMNMLSGIYFPDKGEILIKGEQVSIRSPKDAFENGIGMIHQHFKLVDIFTAVENVALAMNEKGKYSLKAVAARIKDICDKYGFDLDPEQKVYNMSVSQKQTLEIIKVLYRGADILILDEPTAVLTPQEAERLFKVIRNMRDDGKSIIIITHKLNEVLSVSDRVTILRKGELAGTVETKDATEMSLTEMMVGQKVDLDIERSEPVDPKPRLIVKNLTCKNADGISVLDNISFTANSGEVLGIAGISGCGQKELLEAIAGLQTAAPGSSITYYPEGSTKAKELIGKSPRKIRELGVALSFVPEDRLGMGLVGSMGMTENMMLRYYKRGKGIFADKKYSRKLANEIKEELEVVTPGIDTPIRNLSGGNVQKVLIGREIAATPSVLMTAYAVRGLDINTSLTIYHLLDEQKKKGVAVIFVGEDLDVLLAFADKIMVLCAGKVNGIVDARTATKAEIGLLMTNMREEETLNG